MHILHLHRQFISCSSFCFNGNTVRLPLQLNARGNDSGSCKSSAFNHSSKTKKRKYKEFVIAERCQQILPVVKLTGSVMEKEEMCNIFEA